MSVYNDLAQDAGYAYGTPENELLAQQLEQQETEHYYAQQQLEAEIMANIEKQREILFRRF